MRNLLIIPVAITAALIAVGLGVFGMTLIKAIVPIFALTEGTRFQIYVQDPLLYTVGPLYCGWATFRMVFARLGRKHVPPSD